MIEELAYALYRAEVEREPLTPLTDEHPTLSLEDAYSIQEKLIGKKVHEGARVVGKKIGLTSQAMQQALGVEQPDYGHLLDTMAVKNGGTVKIERLLQPKVEAEVAFVLKHTLSGPSLTAQDVLSATEYLVPAIEIIDSRIRNWKIRLADTIADNASSGMFVLGDSRVEPGEIDLPLVEMTLERNGERVLSGRGDAVLGNPATAVAWLANKLAEFSTELKAGEVILSGSLSSAVSISRGDFITVYFTELGSVSVKFE